MTIRKAIFTSALFSTLILAGCGTDVKEELGLKVEPPDEFTVVTRAPLAVPPDYTLRPPRPGAERPNEISVREQAKQTVFGASSKGSSERSTGQNAFLSKLGASNTDTGIRQSIDTEIAPMDTDERPVAERMLFWKDKPPVGTPIDPVEEKKRLEAEGIAKTPAQNAMKAVAKEEAAPAKTVAKKSSKTVKSAPVPDEDVVIEKRNEDILKTP